MYSREIDGKIYGFKFGIGFARDMDKTVVIKDADGTQKKMGLTYAIAGLMDGDFEKLIDCLMYGNKYDSGEKIDRKQIEAWLDSEDVSLEQECKDLLDFFETANFTARKVRDIKEGLDKMEKLQEAQFEGQLQKAKVGTN